MDKVLWKANFKLNKIYPVSEDLVECLNNSLIKNKMDKSMILLVLEVVWKMFLCRNLEYFCLADQGVFV